MWKPLAISGGIMLIKYLEGAGLEGVGRICFAEDMNQWEVFIFMVTKFVV
jgi:hypothetical protein